MSSEPMDVSTPTKSSGQRQDHGQLFIYLMKNGAQHFWLSNVNLKTMTVTELINEIKTHPQFPTDFLDSTTSTDQLSLLHNGIVITQNTDSTLDSLNIKSTSPITVVKIVQKPKDTPKKKFTHEEILRTSMDIRTSFLSPSFMKTIQKFREADALEKIFNIAPGLGSDPIGITVIQSPQMLFLLSEPEALTNLADTRPWVVDAIKYIAATIHSEKGNSSHSRQFSLAQLMHPGLGDNEDMDEDDSESDAAAGPSGSTSRSASQPNFRGQITRDQLTRALNIAQNFGPGANPASMNQNPLSALLGISPTRPTTAPPSSQTAAATTSNPGTSPITGDMVARMLSSALSQLPTEQREQQFDALRHLAQQISGSSAPAPNIPQPSPNVNVGNSQNPEFQEQLTQMRELGITDENLSILALRVSGGDVETAAELIFSGWDGSGAEPDS